MSKTFSGGNLSQSTEFQKNPKQMRLSLPSVAVTVDLTGASNTAAAKIVSAVLVDLNVVNNPDKVVDKNKIRREIKKNRNRLQSQNTYLSHHLGGLCFDGHKDPTILQVDNRRKEITEEHIALTQEPSGSYFGHLSLSSPVKAIDIANGILSYITKKGTSLTNLKLIGCDGRNVNTRWKGGAIRLIEEQLGRPLHNEEQEREERFVKKYENDDQGRFQAALPLYLENTVLIISQLQKVTCKLWKMIMMLCESEVD
nr:unnamed protein product [Callosobruchus analis]